MKRIHKKLLIILIPIGMLAVGFGYWQYQENQEQKRAAAILQDKRDADEKRRAAQAALPSPIAPDPPVVPPAFDKQRFSTDDPASVWVVVNKLRPLNPKEYIPADLVTPNIPLRSAAGSSEMKLRAEAATALETMTAVAKLEGANIMLASGYRSFTTQTSIYNREVATYGQAVADTQSARPGHSEHQTGLGVDLEPVSRQCEIEDCFADTVEGKWLAANAYKYGFILRYTADKTSVTGYRAESWHFRYVGALLSNELHQQGITTLEEFFGLPAAPGY